MTQISEIAPDVFRISTFVPDFNLQISQFVVRDEEPLLFHTGLRALFPAVRGAPLRTACPSEERFVPPIVTVLVERVPFFDHGLESR